MRRFCSCTFRKYKATETTKNSVNQSITVCAMQKIKDASVVSLRPVRGQAPPSRAGIGRFGRLLACASVVLLAGCSVQSPLGYYWQAAAGHLHLLRSARPVAELVTPTAQSPAATSGDAPAPTASPELSPALRARLARTQLMRDFASAQLGLPDNASYRRYADVQRPAAVWNVVAAPVDQLQLHRWCFWVVGCLTYRGYFAEADARAHAAQLREQGWEVHVYGVPAYSTLGWSNWLGGDPLLNTFVHWPEPEVAGLIFHELTHQLIYIADDTPFNEALATAVQRLGTQQWLQTHGTPAQRAAYTTGEMRRQTWRALTRRTRQALAQLYAQQAERPMAQAQLLARKEAVLAGFRAQYAQLRTQWQREWEQARAQAGTPAPTPPAANPWQRTDEWVAQANNASFGALGVYEDWTPAFEAMYHQASGDWPRFYDAVRALARLPVAERHAALHALLPGPAAVPAASSTLQPPA